MKDIAIRVEGLGKRYFIASSQNRYLTLRDSLARSVKAPFRRAASLLRGHATGAAELHEAIWALKDVTFEVERGGVVGIIGSNGAGKSTLLKVLSRITAPTEGYAEIQGRISSLLEVGTGFHPELTGRENVFLNGAILGMKKAEIDAKFDEIVAFAEVERFIDTPVKHYSSGMHVRLAFAVAAHLEPEVLVVDEVLSVGDVAFQRKCVGKMQGIAGTGRTVLFVSHNMGAVANLCETGLWLENGRIAALDSVDSAIAQYLQSVSSERGGDSSQWRRSGSGEARFTAVRFLDEAGRPSEMFSMGDSVAVEFDVEFHRSFREVRFALEVQRAQSALRVLHITNQDCGFQLSNVEPGKRTIRVLLPRCMLYPSTYNISLWIGGGETYLDYVQDVASFSVVQSAVSQRTTRFHQDKGVYYAPSEWIQVEDGATDDSPSTEAVARSEA